MNRKNALFIEIIFAFLLVIWGYVLLSSKSVNSNKPSEIFKDNRELRIDDDITWDEITISGVDEERLIKNINTSDLERIASLLQGLTSEIGEREREDYQFVLEGKWYRYILESEQFKKVLRMGNKALKPLYLIVYKSSSQGLYEYICCMAMERITNYKIGNWNNSKNFLELFNNYILNH